MKSHFKTAAGRPWDAAMDSTDAACLADEFDPHVINKKTCDQADKVRHLKEVQKAPTVSANNQNDNKLTV